MVIVVKKTVGLKSGCTSFLLDETDLATTTIGTLKEKVYSLTNVPPRWQKLIVLGVVLEPDSEMCITKWNHERSLTIHLAPNGGDEALRFFRSTNNVSDEAQQIADGQSEHAELNVQIKSLLLGKTFEISLPPRTTVTQLLLLAKELGIICDPINHFELFCETTGAMMRVPYFAISDYGVTDGAILHVLYSERMVMFYGRTEPWGRLELMCLGIDEIVRTFSWTRSHERRATRIVRSMVALPSTLYPLALAQETTRRENCHHRHDFLFVILRETLASMIMHCEKDLGTENEELRRELKACESQHQIQIAELQAQIEDSQALIAELQARVAELEAERNQKNESGDGMSAAGAAPFSSGC
jgi:hypothetical protein